MQQIARLVAGLSLPVTNQALADLALQADQERRAAERRGDHELAAELEAEVEALAELLQ
jgi:hypothetical protein